MTAICLKANNSTETDTWSNIFTSFNTYTKSCLFIKQLTRTCISTILHLRKVFPEYYFESKDFEGMTLKLLKSKSGENYVSKIEQWLEGAFEAIEKKYLKRLMLDIEDADSNMTLEIYTMTFNYNKERETINSLWSAAISTKNSDSTISNTRLNVIKLLQMCYAVTQTYGSLPAHVKLSIRLSYYENTPEDYQPAGYMAWDSVDPEFSKQARSIEIGITGTQHHFFKLLNKSCLNDKFLKEMKNQLEESDYTSLPMHTHQSGNISQDRQTKAKRELCFENSNQVTETGLTLPTKIKSETKFVVTEKNLSISNKNHLELLNDRINKNLKATKSRNVRGVKSLPFRGDLKVRCACLSIDKSEMMFPCMGCRFLVHAVSSYTTIISIKTRMKSHFHKRPFSCTFNLCIQCKECFGILEFDTSKKIRFYCHLCHQTEDNIKCHDKIIVNLKSVSDQQKLSILRRVLRHCTLPNVTKITLKKIEKIAGTNCLNNVANVVLNKLIEIGVAIPQGKKKNYIIDTHEMSSQLVHYFYKVTSKSIKSSECLKKKNEIDFLPNNSTKQPTAVLQEFPMCRGQESQQSCDIFF